MNSLKVIVAGSRTFNYPELLDKVLSKYRLFHFNFTELIHGGARGADTLAMLWAEKNDIPVRCFPADWDKYGKKAGYIRNKQMAEYGEILIAFWDGQSKGTRMMIELAKEHNVNVIIVKYAWDELKGKAIVTSYSNQLTPAQ